MIVGALGSEEALLYLGAAGGLSSSPAVILTSPVGGDRFGTSVATAGDVNGDGYDDVIVGTEGGSAAYVYLGASSGLGPAPDATLTSATGEYFGWSVGSADDVDGDGYDDVLVGAPGSGSSDGRVYVYLGSSAGLRTTSSVTLEAAVSGGEFGSSLGAAGDVDGDAFGDVIVGTWSAGEAYLFHGAAGGLSTAAATLLEGDPTEFFGRPVSGAGDVNADGYADVIVGHRDYDAGAGRAYVYLGSAVGIDAVASIFLDGEDWGGFSGVGGRRRGGRGWGWG